MKSFLVSSVALATISVGALSKDFARASWRGLTPTHSPGSHGHEPLLAESLPDAPVVAEADESEMVVVDHVVDQASLVPSAYLNALHEGLETESFEIALTHNPEVVRGFVEALLKTNSDQDATDLAMALSKTPEHLLIQLAPSMGANAMMALARHVGTDHLPDFKKKEQTRLLLRDFIQAQDGNNQRAWSQYLFALLECSSEQALEVITEEFYHEKSPARRLAIFYFVEQRAGQLRDVVASALYDSDESINWHAFVTISDWQDYEQRSFILSEAFRKPLPASIRLMMLGHLWEQRAKLIEAEAIVSEVMNQDKDEKVRAKAKELLGMRQAL